MDEERTARIRDWVRNELAEHSCVERVVLFGSRARGDNRAKSDFDFAVVAPAAGVREWDAIREAFERAPTLVGVDLLRYDAASDALKAEIDRDGVEVYARQSRAA